MSPESLFILLVALLAILYYINSIEKFETTNDIHTNAKLDVVIRDSLSNPLEPTITTSIPIIAEQTPITTPIAVQATLPVMNNINKYKKLYMHQLGECQMNTTPADVESLLHSDMIEAEITKNNRDKLADFGKITFQNTNGDNVVDKLAEIRTMENPNEALRSCGKKISDVYNELTKNHIYQPQFKDFI